MGSSRARVGDALRGADLIVVGAGLYGLTVGRAAAEDGLRVVVLDARDHVGGNAWSYPDPQTGIEVHAYGSHIFHTNNERVWDYLQTFGDWIPYQHHVWTVRDGKVYPLPFGLALMSAFYERHLDPAGAADLLARDRDPWRTGPPANLEDKAISLVGEPLYRAFVEGYTQKQWQTHPRDLPASVISRLPVRMTYETGYFTERYQALPEAGYGPLLQGMAAGLDVYLGVDWFDVRDLRPETTPVVYTGPVDRWFDYSRGELGWRTLDLLTEVLPEQDHQGCPVLNYADAHVPWTRVHEFRHYRPDRTYEPGTVIMTEVSRWARSDDEPFYPVNSSPDRAVLRQYRELMQQEPHVLFGGRLGTYQYLDMHMAVAAALTDAERLLPEWRSLAVR